MKPHVLTIALLYLLVICVSAKPTETDGPDRPDGLDGPDGPDGPTDRSVEEIFREIMEKRLGNQNKYDKPHNFACPKGQTVRKITSTHSNYYEDRRWIWTCSKDGAMPDKSDCSWTGWTSYDDEWTKQCNDGYIITGTASKHSNYYEDRSFMYKCCKIGANCEKDTCTDTEYLNQYDKDMKLEVPATFQLVALYSIHKNYYDDRRWKAKYCKYTCGAPSYSIYKVKWDTAGINFDLKPQALSSQIITNNSPATVKSTVTFEETKAEEESTSWDASFESSVTFSSGVDIGIASASTDVTLSFGMSVGQTSTVTTEKTFSKSFEVEVPARSSVEVTLVVKKQDDIAIPFTATLDRTLNGKTTRVVKTGTWRGTLYSTDTIDVKDLPKTKKPKKG